MTSRTALSIILGLACSALAVGGLAWAAGREPAPADPGLDVSAEARAAFAGGLAPVKQVRLRRPAPAPEPAPVVRVAASQPVAEAAAPSVAGAPAAAYEDDDAWADEQEEDDDGYEDERDDEEAGEGDDD